MAREVFSNHIIVLRVRSVANFQKYFSKLNISGVFDSAYLGEIVIISRILKLAILIFFIFGDLRRTENTKVCRNEY